MTIPIVVEGVNATPYEDNMRYFNVAIAGPVGTCYEGKVFSFFLFNKMGTSLSHRFSASTILNRLKNFICDSGAISCNFHGLYYR